MLRVGSSHLSFFLPLGGWDAKRQLSSKDTSVVLISVSTMSSGLVRCAILAVVEEQELLVTSARMAMDYVRMVAKSIIR